MYGCLFRLITSRNFIRSFQFGTTSNFRMEEKNLTKVKRVTRSGNKRKIESPTNASQSDDSDSSEKICKQIPAKGKAKKAAKIEANLKSPNPESKEKVPKAKKNENSDVKPAEKITKSGKKISVKSEAVPKPELVIPQINIPLKGEIIPRIDGPSPHNGTVQFNNKVYLGAHISAAGISSIQHI